MEKNWGQVLAKTSKVMVAQTDDGAEVFYVLGALDGMDGVISVDGKETKVPFWSYVSRASIEPVLTTAFHRNLWDGKRATEQEWQERYLLQEVPLTEDDVKALESLKVSIPSGSRPQEVEKETKSFLGGDVKAARFKLKLEPYNPDARDGDGDGIVQEGTAWERPGGTRLVDRLGREIQGGRTSGARPKGIRVIDGNGKDVDYKPTYGEDFDGTVKPGSLAGDGSQRLSEIGLPNVQQIVERRQPLRSSPTTPQPRQNQEWTPEWTEVSEALDMDFVRSIIGADDEVDDDEVLMNFYERVKDAWEQWNSCRETRKAAYALAGANINAADPNIERSRGYFGNGWETALSSDEAEEMARYLMASLVQDVRSGKQWDHPTLYRAVDVSRQDEEAFWEAMREGNEIDVPLWSFMDRRSQGPNEILTKYGSEVLIEVDDKPHSIEMGIMGGFYDAENERETLDLLDEIVESLKIDRDDIDKDEDEEGWESLDGTIDEINEVLAEYRKEKDPERRRELQSRLSDIINDYGGGDPPPRWEGDEIQEDDSEFYWESFENPWANRSRTPSERISGGRFKVISVEDDPKGVYERIVRLRQIGAFDPGAPGKLVKAKQ